MRPTITEQIGGLRRVLAEIIAPEVTSAYPAEILGGVIGALDSLQASWVTIPTFLRWDIRATAALLDAALPLLAADLAADILRATAETPADITDWAALEVHQMRLRGLLARAVPAITENPDKTDAYPKMIALFRERSERFPFSMAARPAKKA